MQLTNYGATQMADVFFRGATPPANFYLAYVTSAVAPTAILENFSSFTEIAAGNGYPTGGISVARNSTDFDSLIQNNTDNRFELQMKDLTATASGGSIPTSGDGARYGLLLDDNATVSSRKVIGYFDLGADRVVSDGQPLTVQNAELRGAN